MADCVVPDVAFSSSDRRSSHQASAGPVMFSPSNGVLLDRMSTDVLEEHHVPINSDYSVKVYVQRSPGKTAIVTFHDIGTNHNSFLGFFNYREMRVLMRHFTVYHICAPGHHDGAANLGSEDYSLNKARSHRLVSPASSEEGNELLSQNSVDPESNQVYSTPLEEVNLNHSGTPVPYPNMDELADVVASVVSHFCLKYFIGFGMGAGSNILCRYTLKNQDNVRALFLLNPDGATHTYYEWFRLRWFDLPEMAKGNLPDNLLNFLEAHWFGFGLGKENLDLVQYYEQLVRSLNRNNVAGYVDAYLNRTDLGLVRNLAPESARGDTSHTAIKADVCLVAGALAKDQARILANLNGRMDPSRTQFLILEDCNGMMMEERPDKLAMSFLHFLRTNGLLINLLPETLVQEAEKLQNEEFSDCEE